MRESAIRLLRAARRSPGVGKQLANLGRH